jgi:predicted dehydrogenase
MYTFRAAVVGTGFIGPVHVEALRRAGVEVAAVVGSTPEKSRASSLALGVSGNHETLENVLARPVRNRIRTRRGDRLQHPLLSPLP